MADGLLSVAKQQPVTTYGGIKAAERIFKDPLSVTSTHGKLKRSQRHESSIKLRPWLPDYCSGALLVFAGVQDVEVLARNPKSFDGSDALDRTGQLTEVHLATKSGA